MLKKPLVTTSSPDSMHRRILHEARRLFVERGFDGVSVREIAEACGLTKAALYYHFEDKERLLVEILEEGLAAFHGLIESAMAQEATAPGRIRAFVEALFRHLQPEERALIRLAAQEMNKLGPALRLAFAAHYREQFLEPLAAIFRQGQERGEVRSIDPDLAVWILLGMLYPFLVSTSALRPEATPQALETLLTIFWQGMKAE